jgi:hemerythrin-like domain-containing protein
MPSLFITFEPEYNVSLKGKESFMNKQDQPNVAKDLHRIHTIITRGIEVSTKKCREFLDKKENVPVGFLDFVQAFSVVLKAHHETEDELVFPYFREKLRDVPFDSLTSDHEKIENEIGAITAALSELRKRTDNLVTLETLSGVLNRIKEIWHPHIAIEESGMSAEILETLLPVKEHIILSAQFSKHGIARSNPPQLVVPFILYNLEPGPRQAMAANMPKMLTKFILPVLWRNKWIRMKPYFLN